MIYFFVRGAERKSCELRLNPDGEGYELVITENGKVQLERFNGIERLLAREHELLNAWKALGWKEATDRRETGY
jgi:hypothetical protein